MSINTLGHRVVPALQTGLTAIGSSQTTSFPLTNNTLHEFTTVAGSTGAILPVGVTPSEVTIFNNGASTLTIYPPLGGTIDGGSVNGSISLSNGSGVTLWASSPTSWYHVQTAAAGGSGSPGGSSGQIQINAGGGLFGGASTGLVITQSLLAIPTPAFASTVNLDLSTASIFAPVPLTGNVALTLSNAPASSPWVRPFTVILTQDGTGSRTVTSWFSGFTIDWAGGSAPTLTLTGGKRDMLNFVQIGATTLLGSVVGQNY